MPKKRKCGVCRTPFPVAGPKKYCGPACARVRLLEQLKALVERRRAARPKRVATCSVCIKKFTPRTSLHVYCSPTCSKVGLQRAIERQRQRREQFNTEVSL